NFFISTDARTRNGQRGKLMTNLQRLAVVTLVSMTLSGCGVLGQTQTDQLKGFRNPSEGFEVARQGMFFVNGDYYTSRVEKDAITCSTAPQLCQYMAGQMYVEYQIRRTCAIRIPS